jgi:hypothetical protein
VHDPHEWVLAAQARKLHWSYCMQAATETQTGFTWRTK